MGAGMAEIRVAIGETKRGKGQGRERKEGGRKWDVTDSTDGSGSLSASLFLSSPSLHFWARSFVRHRMASSQAAAAGQYIGRYPPKQPDTRAR